ncbi:MAG: hypothetical protein M1819_003613 [Sarea resinae]|nr:MAG: hypothetical protein M1819_003613 [Sarea resinae]
MKSLRSLSNPHLLLLLSTLIFLLFAQTSSAQGLPNLSSASDSAAATTAAGSTDSAAKSSNSAAATTGAKSSNTAAATSGSSTGTDSASSGAASSTAAKTSSGSSAATTKASASGSTITGPALSTTSKSKAAVSFPGLTGAPTLSGAFSYPAPSVPPTANAPYMQHSTLPEGTIFICVGAILGALGLAVIAWRGLVAWSLHRSVKRAAMHQGMADSKTMLRPPGGGFYSTTAGSTLSLDLLTGTKSPSSTAGPKGHTPSGSLFFSPTATAGMHQPNSNRASTYLPAGYYATPGATSPGGGGPGTLRDYSRSRSMLGNNSPPHSPSLPPSRGGAVDAGIGGGYARAPGASTSTLNLSVAPQGRAPSTYLEDLFENHQLDGPGGSGGPTSPHDGGRI